MRFKRLRRWWCKNACGRVTRCGMCPLPSDPKNGWKPDRGSTEV